jgi:hypothetical protein
MTFPHARGRGAGGGTRTTRAPALEVALAVVAAVVAAVAGCSGGPQTHEEPQEPVTETAGTLSCDGLLALFQPVLGDGARIVPQGVGCEVRLIATGESFESIPSILGQLEAAIPDWQPVHAEAADGPTGSFVPYTLGEQRLNLSVEWSLTPEAEAACPDDEPIGACIAAPTDQIFTVQITLVPARES